MSILIDTSVLGRLVNTADKDHAVAASAISELHRRNQTLHITAQSLIEFRNFATRPATVNGLGFSAADVEKMADSFESVFSWLPETSDIYPAWKTLVVGLGVTGKQVHDARLVAICHVHGVPSLLTFNVTHFTRFAGFGPGSRDSGTLETMN
jgi:predicted nucleic acid-binding protein